MAAATEARKTTFSRGRDLLSVPVKAATTVYQGTLVVADAGFAAPGRTAANLIALGRARETVQNAGVAGAVNVEIERGVFLFDNNPADLVTQAELLKSCFITDDQTVQKTTGAGVSVAGKVLEVTADGVWVEVF
jgi:hypothetical protein